MHRARCRFVFLLALAATLALPATGSARVEAGAGQKWVARSLWSGLCVPADAPEDAPAGTLLETCALSPDDYYLDRCRGQTLHRNNHTAPKLPGFPGVGFLLDLPSETGRGKAPWNQAISRMLHCKV